MSYAVDAADASAAPAVTASASWALAKAANNRIPIINNKVNRLSMVQLLKKPGARRRREAPYALPPSMFYKSATPKIVNNSAPIQIVPNTIDATDTH